MQKRSHSPFLLAAKPLLDQIINLLGPHFDYISVLATDDRGLSYVALPGETRTYEPMWVQRGFVFEPNEMVRLWNTHVQPCPSMFLGFRTWLMRRSNLYPYLAPTLKPPLRLVRLFHQLPL